MEKAHIIDALGESGLLLPKKEALALLKWAADNNHGHMAFLRAGRFTANDAARLQTVLPDVRVGWRPYAACSMEIRCGSMPKPASSLTGSRLS